jgi:phytoene synthase
LALAELRGHARGHLTKAHSLLKDAPDEIAGAFLPLAFLPLYLAAMEHRNYLPFATIIEAPQWRRQWALWRAARFS